MKNFLKISVASALAFSAIFSINIGNASADVTYAEISGVGVVNQMAKFISTSTITSSSLLSETNNGIGIGIAVPHGRLDIVADQGGNAISVRNKNKIPVNIVDVNGAGDARTRLRRFNGLETVNILAFGISFFNGGNVGIGTKTPSSLFEVAGLAKFTKAQTGSLSINNGQTITGHLSAVGELDFGTIEPNTCNEQSVAVLGTTSSDTVNVGPSSVPPSTLVWSAYATVDNINIRLCNIGTSAVITTNSSWRADAWKH